MTSTGAPPETGPGPGPGPPEQLRLASARGDLQQVVRLIGEGVKVVPDEHGRTALHLSASAGHADIAAALLIAGANVNAPDSAGCTSLQRAAADGHLDLVKQLLKHKADVNIRDDVHGNTALHEASWKGYSRCVQALCSVRGADLGIRNTAGFAALHLACQNGHNQSCRELLLASCDPDIRNNYGDTPLHTSARYGHAGVTRILVSAQCKVSEQNKNGDTALHIAAAMGRRKLTRILLEAGCDKSLRNKQGETARDIATRKDLGEVISILNTPANIRPPRDKENKEGKDTKDGRDRDGRSKNHKDKKRNKSKSSSLAQEFGAGWSPYGCHYYPDTKSFPQPKLDSLPSEPLRKGEQYYLDLAGNIRKGPVGVGYTCYCAPFFKHMEQRLDRDKHDLKRHINLAVEGLERRTQGHISQLTRSLAAERARCSQRHLHLQQWLRGAPLVGPSRARSVDSLLEKTRELAYQSSTAVDETKDVGDEIEVLSEGDNTARRKESFVRRGGRGKLRLRPGLTWDVLAAADRAMAATDPAHRARDQLSHHEQLLAIATGRSRRKHGADVNKHGEKLVEPDSEADSQARRRGRGSNRARTGAGQSRGNLEVLDEVRKVSEWRDQQRRLMLEVARASREIAQLKRVACRTSSGSSSIARDPSTSDRESHNSRRGRRFSLNALDEVDQDQSRTHTDADEQSSTSQQFHRSKDVMRVEVHEPPSKSHSVDVLRVEPAPPPAPAPGPRWNGVSVTPEDIENWRRMDRMQSSEQDILSLANNGMINNPDYEIQVEDGMIFSSDLAHVTQLPPVPQPQQPTAATRVSLEVLDPPAPSRNSPSAALLHPKPKFFSSFHKTNSPPIPTLRTKPVSSLNAVNKTAPDEDKYNSGALKRSTPSSHVPLRKSVHEMVARIQNHMLHNFIGRQGKNKETRKDEVPIDAGDCVQVQARRVQACQEQDSESSEGEDDEKREHMPQSQQPGSVIFPPGIGPDYENVTCWREEERHLVSELPYRTRRAVYSPDLDADFLDRPVTNGLGSRLIGPPMLSPASRGHFGRPLLNGHIISGLMSNGHAHMLNGHAHSPAGTPDLELELHAAHHSFLPQMPSPYLNGPPGAYPYTGGMCSPDHGDSGYSTRMGGSSNSKGTSPSLSGLDSDGLTQNVAPRSAAALNLATSVVAIASQRHTNASLV